MYLNGKKMLQCHLKGTACSKLANGLNRYDLKKEKDSRGCSYPALGLYTYMYITILVKQVYWYIAQVSGERLQDHWSSGFFNLIKLLSL